MTTLVGYLVAEMLAGAACFALFRFAYLRWLVSRIPKLAAEVRCPECQGQMSLASEQNSASVQGFWRFARPVRVCTRTLICASCQESFVYELTDEPQLSLDAPLPR